MEEETVFQPPQQNDSLADPHHPNNPVNFSPQGPVPQSHTEQILQQESQMPIAPTAPEVDNASQSISQEPISDGSDKRGKLIKLLIGLGGILVAVIIVFVLLNLFKGEKKGQVTITYWGLWEDQQTVQPVIAAFEKQNPNIKIEYSKQDVKDYRERLTTRIGNGTGPDVFRFHNSWYPMMSKELLPIPANVIDKSTFQGSFYPVVSKDLIKNGAIYGIPLEIDTLALYINKDLFHAAGLSAPSTWQDLRSDARALTVKDENGKIQTAGVAAGTYTNVAHAPDIVSLLFAQNGVNLGNIKATDTRVVDGLRFYASFAQDPDSVWDSTLDPSLTAFSKGTVAMVFGYSWDYFNIKAANPNLSIEIASVPQLSPDQPVNLASYWAEGVSSKSKNQKDALAFLKFLTSKTSQEVLYSEQVKTRLFGEPYSFKEFAPRLKDTELNIFLSQAPSAVSSYFVDSTNDNGLNSQLNKYLENAVNSISDNTSAESAALTLEDGFAQVMSQYAGN